MNLIFNEHCFRVLKKINKPDCRGLELLQVFSVDLFGITRDTTIQICVYLVQGQGYKFHNFDNLTRYRDNQRKWTGNGSQSANGTTSVIRSHIRFTLQSCKFNLIDFEDFVFTYFKHVQQCYTTMNF